MRNWLVNNVGGLLALLGLLVALLITSFFHLPEWQVEVSRPTRVWAGTQATPCPSPAPTGTSCPVEWRDLTLREGVYRDPAVQWWTDPCATCPGGKQAVVELMFFGELLWVPEKLLKGGATVTHPREGWQGWALWLAWWGLLIAVLIQAGRLVASAVAALWPPPAAPAPAAPAGGAAPPPPAGGAGAAPPPVGGPNP